MTEMKLDRNQRKEILKTAIVQVLHENREELSELIAEALEEIESQRAISVKRSVEEPAKDKLWQPWVENLDTFSDDFMETRAQPCLQTREELF
jgi:TRAP-type C4-dicarboxylate transport system substrate-binding protein